MPRSRSDWPIRRYRLGEEPPDDLGELTTASQRVAMMWRLAGEGWQLAGRTLPSYRRSEIPLRLYAPGEPRDEE
ncbi:MAG: hypothetical protein SF182_29640 [Deltaproteobacteria bacterium]|nr:hypothetical protein [Deltaproteobacteria bacterium]